MRIGLTADMHSFEPDGSDVAEGLMAAFAGVDRIVACGDHITGAALDRLAALAPLTATANPNAEGDGEGRAEAVTTVLDAAGRSFGVLFSPTQLGAEVAEGTGEVTWPEAFRDRTREVFGRDVDAVLVGGTHTPLIETVDGVLVVNPGSPRFAQRTTAAIVEIDESTGDISPAIIDV